MTPSVGIVGTCAVDAGPEGVAPGRDVVHLGESARQGGEASPEAASLAWRWALESRVQRSCHRSCQSSLPVQPLDRAQLVDAHYSRDRSCQASSFSTLPRLEW